MDSYKVGNTRYVEWDLTDYEGLIEEVSPEEVEGDTRTIALFAIAASVNRLAQEVRQLRLGGDPKWSTTRDTRGRASDSSSRSSEGANRDRRKRRD